MQLDYNLLSLKQALDNSYLELKAEETNLGWIPKIKSWYQHFPWVSNRMFKDFDVHSMYGSFFTIIVPLAVFMVVFDELMKEKVYNLRRGI